MRSLKGEVTFLCLLLSINRETYPATRIKEPFVMKGYRLRTIDIMRVHALDYIA